MSELKNRVVSKFLAKKAAQESYANKLIQVTSEKFQLEQELGKLIKDLEGLENYKRINKDSESSLEVDKEIESKEEAILNKNKEIKIKQAEWEKIQDLFWGKKRR